MSKLKVFSMFTGIGGFEEGFKKAGIDIELVGYSEIEKNSCMILKKQYPTVRNYGDATKIKETEVPDMDVICAGFPCQAFSMSGKRMGFEDTRGTLFYDIARIIKSKKPKILFLENVEGLLNHEEGRTFAAIISTLDELGYDAEWQLCYSYYAKIPQNRPRVYIIGHKRGESQNWVFPLEQESKGTIRVVQNPKSKLESAGRVWHSSGIAPTLTRTGAQDILIGDWNRTITIHEGERLQGFPDDWTKYGIDANGNQVEINLAERFARIGNAVTVDMIKKIVISLLQKQ